MTEYKVVTGESKKEFEMLVNLELKVGWQLVGGVSMGVYLDRNDEGLPTDWFAQAMTREKAES